MIVCSKCNKKVKKIKTETFGFILIFSIIPADLIMGINIVSIIYDILSISVGLNWILKKPSKNFVCDECLTMAKEKGTAIKS